MYIYLYINIYTYRRKFWVCKGSKRTETLKQRNKRGNNILHYKNRKYWVSEGLRKLGFWAMESTTFNKWKSDFGLLKVKEPEKHEKRAVMAARVIGKFCWLLLERTSGALAESGAPNRDFPTKEPSISARLTSVEHRGNSAGRAAHDQDFEHWTVNFELYDYIIP